MIIPLYLKYYTLSTFNFMAIMPLKLGFGTTVEWLYLVYGVSDHMIRIAVGSLRSAVLKIRLLPV